MGQVAYRAMTESELLRYRERVRQLEDDGFLVYGVWDWDCSIQLTRGGEVSRGVGNTWLAALEDAWQNWALLTRKAC